MKDDKVIAIIPARFGSTRFPGKPLADICGKTMIQRVYEDDYRYVINVQGDEPTINVQDINSLINVIKEDPFKIATLVGSLEKDQMRDRNTVKAYIENNEIKLFTRSPISTSSIWLKRHIGVYALPPKLLTFSIIL